MREHARRRRELEPRHHGSRNFLYTSSGIASTSRTTQTVRAKLPRFGDAAASAEVIDARS
jgi:hypothetical protein